MQNRLLSIVSFRALAGLFGLAFSTATLMAQTYTLTDLGALPGPIMVSPAAINNQGQVAGSSISHALLYSNGSVQDLGTLPGGSLSVAKAINSLGEVAGYSQFTNGGAIYHAALFRSGTVTDLGVLPDIGNYSFGLGINSAGQVVGIGAPSASSTSTLGFIWDAVNGIRSLGVSTATSINDSGAITGKLRVPNTPNAEHAYLLASPDGVPQDLGTIGGDFSSGAFINANGHVTGSSTILNGDNRDHAFLYDGTMRDLGSLGPNSLFSDFSYGHGININDEVVGSSYRRYTGGALYQVAFVYRNGVMSDLEKLVDASGSDYRLYTATAINDAGQIVVEAIKVSTGASHAVLLTPVTSGSDTVTVTKAIYNSMRQQLTVQATDLDSTATLQAYVTSTDTLLGSLRRKATTYTGKFSVATNPLDITVKSSLGGSDSAPVTGR